MHSGGQLLVKTLQAMDVDTVFCVAGESYLPALDALLDTPEIKVITCRHESGATFMAESYGSMTGKPGIAFVTRGPGACNGSIGLHAGTQSSAPMIMFVGLIHSDDVGKEAFQEFDLPQMFGSISKHAVVIERAEDIQSMTAEAFKIALSDRPGPVVVGLPEDVLVSQAQEQETSKPEIAVHQPKDENMDALAQIMAEAKKPLIIVGGSLWRDEECAALENIAEEKQFPVAASFRRQDLFNHNHACYVGEIGLGPNPQLIAYAKEADVVIALGARISDILTQGYTLFEEAQKLIHVYSCDSVFGKAYKPDLAIQSHIGPFFEALSSIDMPGWEDWVNQGRQNYEAWTDIVEENAGWNGADMTQIFRQLREVLPADAIVTTDAGNFAGWVNRYLCFGRPGRQIAPLSGAMGYGVPAAVAASIAQPDRLAIGFCGDGGFMMTGQEIATAIQQGAKPIIVVCNNNMYGTIRMHQEQDFPGRVSATDLLNPDFVKLAESYGAFAARVTHENEFQTVWSQAVEAGKPALIEIQMDPRQISTVSKV